MLTDGKSGYEQAKKAPPDYFDLMSTPDSVSDFGHDGAQTNFDPMLAFGDEAASIFESSAAKPSALVKIEDGEQNGNRAQAGDDEVFFKGPEDGVAADGDPKDKQATPAQPKMEPAPKVEPVVSKEVSGEKTVEAKPKSPDAATAKQVEEFDAKFADGLKGLDKTIETASKEKKTADESIAGVQLQSLNLLESLGKEQAGREGTNKDAGPREKQLEQNSKLLELQARGRMETLPTKQRDLLVMRSTFLIASGKDENIRAGEKQLAELVRDYPGIGVDEKFHETVLRAYAEMAAMRAARGLGDWQSELKVDDILPALPSDTNKPAQTSLELLEAASNTFFADGITKALPQFDKAKARAALDVNTAERARISTFIEAIGINNKIVVASASGKDITELAEQRSQQSDKEIEAYKQSREAKEIATAISSNCAFAKLAGGDARQYADGKKELAAILEKNPTLALNPEFTGNARNAFKAHFASEAGKPDTTDGDPDIVGPGKIDPKNTELDLKKSYKKQSDDPEVKGYGVDTATTIGLYGVTIGMGIVSFIRTRNAIRNARAMKAQVEAAHTVKPINSGAEHPPIRKGAEQFSVKGQATDGRIVLKTEQPKPGDVKPGDASTETKPFAEIKPENFNPKKAKFGEFTPFLHDGKRYYADKDGTVYEHSGSKLKETAATRELRLINTEEFKSHGGVIETPPADKPADKPATDKPADPGKPTERTADTAAGADRAKAIADRIAQHPTIKAGLDVLVQQGKTELAGHILDLKAAGKLPTRVEAYLTSAGASRLADQARVDLVSQLVTETRAGLGLATPAPTAVPGGDGVPKEGTTRVEGTPQTERHDSLTRTGETGPAKVQPAELMVTVSHTGSDGVTRSKRVSLLDLSPEQLGERLHALTEEKLAGDIKATEEKIKVAEAEKRSADLEKLTERLADLNALKTMKGEHELAKKSGNPHEFLAKKQAEARAGFGGRALKGLGTAGVVSALLLLFNDLAPDLKFGNDSGDRVLPGSQR